jgi:hypothetical protein
VTRRGGGEGGKHGSADEREKRREKMLRIIGYGGACSERRKKGISGECEEVVGIDEKLSFERKLRGIP